MLVSLSCGPDGAVVSVGLISSWHWDMCVWDGGDITNNKRLVRQYFRGVLDFGLRV